MLPPGIHHGVPARDYHAMIEAVSNSMLNNIDPPARLPHYLTAPREETAWSRVGTLTHSAIIEPNAEPPAIAIEPETYPDSKTAEPKPWHNGSNYCKSWRKASEDQGRIVLTRAEWATVNGCVQSVRAHPQARGLFARGSGEVTVISPALVDGHTVLRRCRIDWVPEADALTDIKTTAGKADRESFAKDALDRGYFRQAAWYLDLWNRECATPQRKQYFVFVVVEKSAPFLCAVHVVSEAALARGEREVMRRLRTFVACRESGVWPGYPEEVGTLDYPGYSREVGE